MPDWLMHLHLCTHPLSYHIPKVNEFARRDSCLLLWISWFLDWRFILLEITSLVWIWRKIHNDYSQFFFLVQLEIYNSVMLSIVKSKITTIFPSVHKCYWIESLTSIHPLLRDFQPEHIFIGCISVSWCSPENSFCGI